MNERPLAGSELTANHREILPYRCMGKKLSDQGFSVRLGFCKEQNTRSKTIDAMYDERSLSFRPQFGTKKG